MVAVTIDYKIEIQMAREKYRVTTKHTGGEHRQNTLEESINKRLALLLRERISSKIPIYNIDHAFLAKSRGFECKIYIFGDNLQNEDSASATLSKLDFAYSMWL